MSASIVALTTLAAIVALVGMVIAIRILLHEARVAACWPEQEARCNRRVSARAAGLFALSVAAGIVAFAANDLVRGDTTWRLVALLALALAALFGLITYVGFRAVQFPGTVFLFRAEARGVTAAGGWGRHCRLLCMRCGYGRSQDLHKQMATGGAFTWTCSHCGNMHSVKAAPPCLTSASSRTHKVD